MVGEVRKNRIARKRMQHLRKENDGKNDNYKSGAITKGNVMMHGVCCARMKEEHRVRETLCGKLC